ncbi:extracellular solute-binding protein [Paenibacillus sp. J5C_2022]|uniref:extracellular solute-binding protein n=1 Tax=Paenibacillus sp. J5C2022 TaxID=2977129 RepID=UPI0021D0C5F5|nr:extracellular solute-binding protein [Paenibacillus sp. J5C2022]MCU6711436.1 extracellular solute-binding protein [Paenibacillus sp. J5C2022]
MKNRRKQGLIMLLAMCLFATMLAACSGNDNNGNNGQGAGTTVTPTAGEEQGSKTPEAATLNIMLWGDKPKQFDEVVAEFERRTKDTLNLKLNFTFTPQADYVNKLKLKLSAGEQVDIAFDAPWMNMNTFIAQDNYTNLDEYFNNDQYPGLKKAFGEGFLDNNRFVGADGKLHVYGVPLGQYLGDLGVIYYRKDLSEKYGIGELSTYEELLEFFGKVTENDAGMIPFVIKNDGHYGAVTAIEVNKPMHAKYEKGIWPIQLGPNVEGTVLIQDNKVVAANIKGEKLEAIESYPEPFNKPDHSVLETVREWHDKGYIEKEPIVRKDASGTFAAGRAAAMMEGLSNLDNIKAQLTAGVPSAEMGVFLVSKAARENVQPNPAYISDFRVWNFLAIPKTSVNADRAMAFINWLFESQENHDLFEIGIEGTHWEAIGEDKFKYPDGVDMSQNYVFPGYMLTWNPNYIRLSENVPDNLVDAFRYLADEKTYVRSALAGFAFNQDPVKNELANPDFGTIASDELAYKLGMVVNPEEGLTSLQQKWEANSRLQADIAKIKEELIRQTQEFLDQQAAQQ